ncbi:hypothetical protein V7S43_009941 [Phytophthora oleae]|uniref:M96 mating-specific protein family n=1 Tax=Phytophthora oleae TaxID=2107226 RepID=A0ABD3FED4_9STRA
MADPDQLSGLLPYLDGIFDNLNSDDDDDAVETMENQEGNHTISSSELLTKKSRRKQNPDLLPYSTSLQRRKKAKLHALRVEAQQLTVRKECLLQALGNKKTADTKSEIPAGCVERHKWHSEAMTQYEKLVRAERTNRELKEILMQQFKVFQSVRKEIGQSGVLEGMEFLERLHPTADRPFFQLDFSAPILAALSSRLDQLSLQADLVLPEVNQDCIVTFHTQSRHHLVSGHCFEVTSTTQLAYSARETGEILWRVISNKENDAVERTFSFARERTPQHCDEVFNTSCIASLIMEDANQAPFCVDAVSTFRKYEEKDRVIIVGSMGWLLPTEGLEFEGNYWAVISSPPTSPANTCAVRFCYRLRVKNAGSQSIERTQKIVNCIGNHIRCYLQLQQDSFFEKVDPGQ